MTRVFIGGSRRLTRLSAEVRRHLDRIIESRLPVLIGDANGIDKAVQQYLQSRDYEDVEVFCTEGTCRNNVGHWRVRGIPAPRGQHGFDYYAAKDQQMAEEASVGFMIWDGKSKGTLANVYRLIVQGKKVVVYNAPMKNLLTLKDNADWQQFLDACPVEVRERIEQYRRPGEQAAIAEQGRLL